MTPATRHKVRRCPRLIAGLLGLMCALPAPLLAQVGTDVMVPDEAARRQAQARTKMATARFIRDEGEFAIIELAGNYDRDLPTGELNLGPRTAVAEAFYANHDDEYDFLVVFTSFEFATPGAVAFYVTVFNDIEGIGQDTFDNRDAFGQSQRLQGYIDMAAYSRYELDSLEPDFDFTLDTMVHEVMHRWGVFINYRNAANQTDDGILGYQGAHWGHYVDSNASVMGGGDWRDNGDGSFTALNIRHRYGDVDLYNAGMLPADRVDDFFVIRNADGDPLQFIPQIGDTTGGNAEPISIDQVIAEEGPRIPGFDASQREFRAGFIMLVAPGQFPGDELLASLNDARRGMADRFNAETRGLGVIKTRLARSSGLGVGDPRTVSGAPPANGLADFAAAVDWLLAAQDPAGYWQDKPGTAVRDTALALAALESLQINDPALVLGRNWIGSQQPDSIDETAWMLAGGASGAATQALLAELGNAQNGDGGWGLGGQLASSPYDTALVLSRVRDPGAGALLVGASGFLLGARRPGSGWGALENGGNQIATTALALDGLIRNSVEAAGLSEAFAWLASTQRPGGGFGEGNGSAHETALAMNALGLSPATPAAALDQAGTALEGMQGGDGSWSGSVYSTSLALLALRNRQNPNLSIAAPPTIDPVAPRDGDIVEIAFTVANSGLFGTPAVTARAYSGDPNAGGTPLGAPVPVPALAAGESYAVTIPWDTFDQAGIVPVFVWADTDELVTESAETDNFASIDVTVDSPPAQADVAVLANTLNFSPTVVGSLPVDFRADIGVRNLSTSALNGVTVALQRRTPSGALNTLNTQQADFAARETRALSFTTPITEPGLIELRIIADPDDLIAEPNEQDNEIGFSVPTADALDLAVLPGEMQLLTATPMAGQDVAFRVVVRNQGTVDAPPAQLEALVEFGGESHPLLTETVQLNAGAASQRDLIWRAPGAGSARLVVSIDPLNVVVEGDEGNNQGTLDFSVAAVAAPNLAVDFEDLIFTPDPALEGQSLNVSIPVSNTSANDAGAFDVEFFEGVPDDGGTLIDTVAVAGLAAGARVDIAIDTAPLVGGGERLFFVAVDRPNAVAEFDEDDNNAFDVVDVLRLPDLAITPASVVLAPSQPVPGGSVSATVAVDNLGQQDATDVTVALYELSAAGQTLVAPAQTIAAVAANSSAMVMFDWSFDAAGAGVDRLLVVVDEADQVVEISNDNNSATVRVDLQNQDFFTSERYISPNGDGVKDETGIGYKLPAVQTISLVIENANGDAVRTFDLPDTQRGEVIWDGRNDRGSLVRDGPYQIKLLDADNVLFGQTLVIVDTNRLPTLNAAGTPAAYFTDLRCSVEFASVASFSVNGRYVYSTSLRDLNGDIRSGLFRIPTRGRGLDQLLRDEFLAQLTGGTFIGDVAALPDGRVLFSNGAGCANCARGLWIKPTPLAAPVQLDTANSAQFDVYHVGSEYALIEDLAPDQWYKVFYQPGVPAQPLVMPDTNMRFSRAVEGGWLMSRFESRDFNGESEFGQALWFVSADPGVAPTFITFGPELQIATSPDGRYFAVVATDDPFNVQRPGLGVVRAGRIDTQAAEIYFDRSMSLGDAWDLQVSLSPNNELLIADGITASIELFDPSGLPIGEIRFPTDLIDDYIATVPPEDIPRKHAPTGEGGGGSLPPITVFVDLDGPVVYSSDTNEIMAQLALVYPNSFGERKSGSQPGLKRAPSGTQFSQLYRVGLDDREPILIGTINDEADDEIIFPQQLDLGDPSVLSWLSREDRLLIDSNNVNPIALDLRPEVRIDDGLGLGRLRRAWPDGFGAMARKYYIDFFTGPDEFKCPGSGSPVLFFESADNLIAHLEVARFASVIELNGVAADRHLQSFQLDWAYADDPDTWFTLSSASDETVIDDLLASWVPPDAGSFLVRLRVMDRAGNMAEDIRSLSWLDPASLAEVQVEPRHISPNGDGIQDAATLSFRVLQPLNLDVTIENENGQVLRVLSGQYPSVTGATEALLWDGRDDLGRMVPEGVYLMRVQNRRFRIVVDITPPSLTLSLPRAYQPEAVDGSPDLVDIRHRVRAGLHELNLDEAVIEFRRGNRPWNEFELFTSVPDDQPIERSVGRDLFVTAEFRLVASDRAGNRAQTQAINLFDDLILTDVRQFYLVPTLDVSEPPRKKIDRARLPYIEPPFPSPEFPDVLVPVVSDRLALEVETTFADLFDQFFIELADPSTPDSWISLPKEPAPVATEENFESSQDLSSPFRHLFLLPLTELLGLEDVLVRIRGDIGSMSFFSNGMRLGLDPGLKMSTMRRAITEILRGTLEPEQDVDLVLALRDLVPPKDTTITQFWVRESLVGLPENTRLLVESSDDARYLNQTAFLPVTETRLLPPSEFSAEMFEVPTAPCRRYEVNWEADFPDGLGGTRPVSFADPFMFTRSCLEIETTRYAVPGLFCAENSSEEIELHVVLTTDDPDILPTTLDIFDVGANGQETLVANVVAPRINQVYPLSIDASLLSEGQRALTIRVVDSVGDRVERRVLVPVDRQAPEPTLDFPANGERLCAVQDGSGAIQFPLEGVIEDDFEFVYKALLGSGHDAPDLKLIGGSPNEIMVGQQKISCSLDFAGIIHERCFDNSGSAFGELGLYDFPDTHEFELTTGPTTGVVEAMDWSGRRYCSISRFDLDASVDAAVVGEFGLISPNGDGAFDTAQIGVQALEPLTMSVSLYAAARSSQGWVVIGNPITQLVSDAAVEGDFTFDWGGDDGTGVLPDGLYGLRFEFVDNCGLSATLDSFGEIDVTPPDVILDYPLNGDPVGAIVEVLGGFTDRNFSLATVSYGVDDAFITLETHTGEVPPSNVIATWVLVGLAPQTYNLRVFARDAAFNEAEVVVPIDIVAITSLIWALEAEPPLFSPNNDGVQDSTDVRLGVQDPGLFTLRAQTAGGGATIRTLGSNLTLNAGTQNFAWDGANDAGTVVPDGDYFIVVDASDTGGSGFNQTEQITVTVDTTPPTLQLINPQDAVVKGTGAFVFDASDPHFLYLRAWNTPLDPPAPQVQLLDRTLTGMVTTGDLADLEEGSHRLRLEAADRAGNVSETEHDYVIDNTPPEATLISPEDGALLGGEQTTVTITGEVGDANFAGYALAVRPAGTMDPWIDIAAGNSLPADEVLAEWTINVPDGAYELRLLATDQAGWETFVVIDVVIDTTAPTAVITAPADEALVNLGAEITGTASDDNFKQYRLRIAEAAGSPIWSDIGIKDTPVADGLLLDWNSLPPDGRYRLQLVVEDEVGLTGTAEVVVQVDQTPPQPPSNLRAETQPGFNVRLDWDAGSGDDLAGYRIRRGGAVLNAALVTPTNYLDPDVPEGEHAYFVVAVDLAGNESEPTNIVTVTIDRTPPDVVLIEPAEGERVRGAVDIVGTASSADDFFEYRLYVRQQGEAAPGALIIRSPSAVIGERLASWDSTTVAQEQTYVFLLEGEDTSGNVATSERSVIVDNLAPAAPLNLTAVLQGQNDAQIDWNANTEADLAGYLLFRDGQLVNAPGDAGEDLLPFALPDTSYLDQGLSDGTHQYQVFAIDLAGNVSAPSNTAEVTVETGPPDLTIVEPEDGARFEAPLFILATSDDLDIASVQFEYRAQGSATWLALGSAILDVPYQTTLDPETLGLSFGDFEIRGVATDDGGLTDPTPPVVAVVYADLTAPDPAVNLTASVAGGDVTLNWQASPSADVDEYLIYRGDDGDPIEEYDSVDADSTTYVDVNLADGNYQYYVVAADAEVNESTPSNTVDALVHTPSFAHPFTPTRDPSVSVQARSLVTGTVSGQLDNDSGSTPVGPVATAADGSFDLGPLALAEGLNSLSFSVTDPLGNVSKPGLVVMQKGVDPAAPTNPAVVVTGSDVDFSWDPSPEPNVVGYRPFRDGEAQIADARVTSGLSYSASSNSGIAFRVGDNNFFTYWNPTDADLADASPTWLQVQLSAPALLTQVRLDYRFFGRWPLEYSIEAWSGFVWVEVARVVKEPGSSDTVDLIQPYYTDRLRMVVLDYTRNLFLPVAVSTMQVFQRPLLTTTSFADTVPDGIYDYQATAVNDYGFESPLSAAAIAEVGDVEPPPPVVLSGSVAGADASLSWTESVAPDLAEYRLFRDGAFLAFHFDLANRDYVDAGLMNGSYQYFVVPVDTNGNVGDPSNTVQLTIAVDTVEPPQNLSVTAANRGGALDLSWQSGGGVPPTAYRIKRALISGGPYDFVAETGATSYTDAGLSNGTTYFYVVHALDAFNNESGPSNEDSGTPRDVVAPAAPELYFPTVPGVPVTINALSTDVAGIAEPGVNVELSRNGAIVGTVRASDDFMTETVFANRFISGALISPDGRHLLIDDFPDQLFNTGTLTSRAMPFAFSSSTWAPDGQSLFVVADDFFGELREYDLDGQLIDVIHDWVDVAFGAGSPDGSLVLAAGTTETTMKGTGVDGVWLIDRASGAVTRIGTLAGNEVPPFGVRFSHDGSKIALLLTSLSELAVYDVASGQLTTIGSDVRPLPPAWSHDDTRLAFTGGSGALAQIFIAEVAGGAVMQVSDGINAYERSAWSSDDRYLAYVDPCCEIVISEVETGLVAHREFTPSIRDLRWLNDGRLFLQRFDEFSLVEQPGYFVLEDMALTAGGNEVVALAFDDGANFSLPSAPILIQVPVEGFPDLAILSSDLGVLPAGGAPGDSFQVNLLVRNLGLEDAPPAQVSLLLLSPDGTSEELIADQGPVALAGGGQQAYSVAIGPLDLEGVHRLVAFVDPGNQIAEVNETNNLAEASFRVTAATLPTLTLMTDRAEFPPDEPITGMAEVYNPGAPFSGRVEITAEDAGGFALDFSQATEIRELDFATSLTVPIAWNAGTLFSGAYRFRAVLFDDSGTEIRRTSVEFRIGRVAEFALTLSSPQTRFAQDEQAPFAAELRFLEGNLVIQDAALRWRAIAPGGGVVWTDTTPLGAMLQGFRSVLNQTWPVGPATLGVYRVRVELESADAFAEAELLVNVVAPQQTAAITGTLSVDSPVVAIGRAFDVAYAVENSGSVAASNLPISLRLLRSGGLNQILGRDSTVDLAVGQRADLAVTWDSSVLGFDSYLIVLSADLTSLGGAADVVLDSASISGIDATPPELDVLSPLDGAITNADVLLTAESFDQLSAVEAVTVRLDGGNPQAMGIASEAVVYQRWLFDLPEGPHDFQVRSADTWSNEVESIPRSFTVDRTAPLIDISGVDDGDLLNVPVQPVITVTDLHLDQVISRLNGADFVSGTTLASDGVYGLSVSANDLAGNEAERRIGFVLDFTPPLVTVNFPTDGTELSIPTTAVTGTTEAGALVDIRVGAFSAQTTASAAGQFDFQDVPLTQGANTLALDARDPAGNQGPETSLVVTFTVPTADLAGAITPPPSPHPIGQPLSVGYSISNSGNADAVGLPVRLNLINSASGLSVASATTTIDLAAGSTGPGSAQFDTQALALGGYRLDLEADQGGFVLLDTAAVTLADQAPPQISPVQPAAGSVHPQTLDIAALVTDQRSPIDRAEYLLDSNPAAPLSLADAATGEYRSTAAGLSHGPHSVSFRAFDVPGNETMTSVIAFEVDALPPAIVISGVDPGGLYNAAVTPTITVTDDNLDQVTTTLDGLDFASGTPVTLGGPHVLQVNASDVVGNDNTLSVAFELDLTPPLVTVTSPADGARIAGNSTDLTGSTEANATVTLTLGAYTDTQAADGGGRFDFSAVPIALGGNSITLNAVDRAGNRGPDTSLSVIGLEGALIVGELQLGTDQHLAGEALAVPYRLRNDGDVAVEQLPTRVAAYYLGAGTGNKGTPGTPIDTAQTLHDLPAGGEVSFTLELNTDGWDPGSYTIALEVELPEDGSGEWTSLATGDLVVSGATLNLTVLFPADGAMIAAESTDVFGDTAAGATVTLTKPGFSASVTADAAGRYLFTAVPIQRGTNVLTLLADNGAQTSQPVTLTVIGPALPIPGLGPGGMLLLILLTAVLGAAALRVHNGRPKGTVHA